MPEETEDEFLDRILGRIHEPEELDADLATGLVQANDTAALRHRFIVADPYKPASNAHYNRQAAARKDRAEKCKAAQDWWGYVDAHEKDFWPVVLEEIKDTAPQPKWAHAVRCAWYNSDDLWKNRDIWVRIFTDRTRLAGITESEELAHFARQSDPLTIYRGCHREHIEGMSWSLEENAAEGFARRLSPRGIVVRGTASKEHVIAYLCPNGEEYEVIISPKHVADITIIG